MNMKQFKYVLVLASTGSFGKAAEALDISQPSLSQYIKKIEQQVGMELFDRTGGNVRLTDAGRIYVDAGRKILDLEHQMQSRISDVATYKTGSVIVGTSPYRSAGMLPAVVKRFREQYPGMQVMVEEMTTDELLEATEHGQFDICLTVLPIDDRLFDYEKIMEEELVLAVPISYPEFVVTNQKERKYPAIDAGQMNHGSFIMLKEGQAMQKALNNLCVDKNLELNRVAVVKSLEAQIAMVRAGVGMAFVPAGVNQFCSNDEVRFYSLTQELPKREVVVIWRKDRQLNQATKDMIDMMKDIQW